MSGHGRPESYAARLAAEKRRYTACGDVHGLPPIFHYWSNKYIRPKFEALGFHSPDDLFRQCLNRQCERRAGGEVFRFVSLGSGSCGLEIELALDLKRRGRGDFVIQCVELNDVLLERGRQAAAAKGIADHLEFTQADLNAWSPAGRLDAAIANQALHHVVNLEGLFSSIQDRLQPGGRFIVCDMIGRNGHRRWPEALRIVRHFWRKLPPSYRYNRQLERYEERFEDWDCSTEGFEGMRSQDILPLLASRFRFQLFAGYGNAIDPFLDRSFGPHFNPTEPWDREFIDQVHARDEAGLASGELKPTHMAAVLGNEDDGAVRCSGPGPEFSIRWPDAGGATTGAAEDEALPAYDWQAWPHGAQRELEVACRRLRDLEDRLAESRAAAAHFAGALEDRTRETDERTAWALNLKRELEERTAWALDLERELKERTVLAGNVNRELEERTAWALKLHQELEERTALALKLGCEVEERTAWALRLEQELRERTEWALSMQRELEEQARRQAGRNQRTKFSITALRNRAGGSKP